jgi:hypothetical protein
MLYCNLHFLSLSLRLEKRTGIVFGLLSLQGRHSLRQRNKSEVNSRVTVADGDLLYFHRAFSDLSQKILANRNRGELFNVMYWPRLEHLT